MKKNNVYMVWLPLAFAVIFAGASLFQSRAAGIEDFAAPVHMSVDWSSRHLIYSGRPTGLNAWAATQDPRYLRHHSIYGTRESSWEEHWAPGDWFDRHGRWPFRRPEESPLQRDWQLALGANATTGNPAGDFSYPAKFSFDVNAAPSCVNDFVVFPTGLSGATGSQASIVAINQLYSGSGSGGTGICGSGQPSVRWAYNTNLTGDTGGLIYSSPVLSIDGSKVAFVETPASGSGAAILKVLKWVSGQGTVGAAVAPTPIATGNPWSTCPVTGTSCLFSLAFSNSVPDSNSSPFYNYGNDSLYVGDDAGKLHKFTGIFNGTPAEVTTGGWPFTIAAGNYLTGPVFDAVSGNIFVSDGSLVSSAATRLHYVRETGSAVGTCVSGITLPCIGTPSLVVSQTADFGVFDPPIVDQTSQRVFVFTGIDLSGNGSVIQANTALGGSVNTAVQSGNFQMFSGAFDKNYNAGNYSTGFLYVCGTNPTTLFRIGFNSSGVMNSTKAAGSVDLQATNSGGYCTPATEFLNGTNDFLFFGMYDDGAFTGCSTGCLVSLNLTTMTWPPNVSAFSSLPITNGLSGIVVDNVGGGGQESSIYFGPQSNNCVSPSGSGCAVKVTQSGLH
jgi:hypothetical protein